MKHLKFAAAVLVIGTASSGAAEPAQAALGGSPIRIGLHYNPEYSLTGMVGVDLFNTPLGQFLSFMATPRGPMLFGGQSVSGLSTGMVLTPKRLTWGLGWGMTF